MLAHALDRMTAAGVDAIVCTGDLADGPGDVAACCELLREANAVTVRGNHDRWLLEDRIRHIPNAHRMHELDEQSVEFMRALPTTASIETVQGRVLLCHGVGEQDLTKIWPGSERMPPERSTTFDAFVADPGIAFMVNGHMHFRAIVHFHGLTLINAGTLRRDHRPGFGVVDLENGTVRPYAFEGTHTRELAHVPLAPNDEHRVWRDTQEFDGDWTPLGLY